MLGVNKHIRRALCSQNALHRLRDDLLSYNFPLFSTVYQIWAKKTCSRCCYFLSAATAILISQILCL